MENLQRYLEYSNPWWQTNEIAKELKEKRKRIYYHLVLNEYHNWLSKHKVLLIEGPRQVGKTLILYQLIDELLSQ
ncbi:MAG TPA: AAA family ATPase, partial [bacterium]|nr:AAA family ATPase [bacterium]